MFNNSGVTTLEFQVIFIRHRSGTFFRHAKYDVQQKARNVITYPDGRRAYGPWKVTGTVTSDTTTDTTTEPMKLRRFHL